MFTVRSALFKVRNRARQDNRSYGMNPQRSLNHANFIFFNYCIYIMYLLHKYMLLTHLAYIINLLMCGHLRWLLWERMWKWMDWEQQENAETMTSKKQEGCLSGNKSTSCWNSFGAKPENKSFLWEMGVPDLSSTLRFAGVLATIHTDQIIYAFV